MSTSNIMEPERVPKSLGCLPHKALMLKINSFRSNSFRSNSFRSSSNSKSNSSSPNVQSPRSPAASSLTLKTRIYTNLDKEREFREVFARFDTDNNGKISGLELRSYFGSVGEYMSQEEAQGVIDEVDTDGDGMIDFRDFMRLMNVDKEEEKREDVKAAFEMFEFEKGSGRISAKSLQRTLSRIGENTTYDECLQMIKVVDRHGKGAVDFDEFHHMMTA